MASEVVRASSARAWLQGDPRRAIAGSLILRGDALEFRAGAHTLRIALDRIVGVARHTPFADAVRVAWRIGRADVDVVWQLDESDAWIAALRRLPD